MGGTKSSPAGSVASIVAALVLGIALWGVLQGHIISINNDAPRRYSFQGEPLLTNYDGWFYLRMARDIQSGTYEKKDSLRRAFRPKPAPLISQAAIWFSDIAGLPLRTSAYFLPAVLALLMIPLYIVWARVLGVPNAAIPAIMAAVLSMYWFRRASVGWYDTDVLNLFFSTLLPLVAYAFTYAKGMLRSVWLVVFFLILAVFDWWWARFGLLMGLVSLGAYALTVVVPSSKTERTVKLFILAVAAGVAYLLFSGLYAHLPHAVAGIFDMLQEHVRLVLGASGTAGGRGAAVGELAGVNILDLAVRLAGSVVAFAVGAAGFLLMLVMRPKQAVFLLALLLPGLFAVTADRFALWLVPPFALGFGFVFCFGADLLSRTVLPQKYAGAACFLVALLVLVPNVRACWEFKTRPVPIPNTASFLAGARTLTPANAVLWNWWDEGYALQYLGERRTFIDGGLTSSTRYFLSCTPLAMSDPGQARRWIRYFSAHGVGGLTRVIKWAGSEQQAVKALKRIFAAPDRAEKVLKAHGVKNVAHWKKLLFPDVKSYLYLPRDTIMHLDAIMQAERDYFDPGAEREDHFRHGPLSGIRISRDGIVDLAEPESLWTLTRMTPSGLDRQNFGRRNGQHGFVSEQEDLFFMLDSTGMQTLLARLMVGTPKGVSGFRPVAYNPLGGGVWEVE